MFQITHKLHHGSDMRPLLLFVPGNSLAAQQAALLGRIPVELDWAILGRIATLRQDAERLQDADSARTIVVCARCRQEREEVVC